MTPFLFKERLAFIYTLGVYPRINKVYARLPDMLPIKSKHVDYFNIASLKLSEKKRYNDGSNKILIFSLPNQDYGLGDEEKFKIYLRLIDSFKNKTVIIKPHPREDSGFFDRFKGSKNVQILRKDRIGENIDYFEFEKIINFSSSVIIDILMTSYPRKAVYTIFMKENSELAFFKETTCIKLSELQSYNFEN